MTTPNKSQPVCATTLEAATKAIYEDKGDRKGVMYVGWEHEPEEVKAQWRVDVRFSIESYLAALSAPVPDEGRTKPHCIHNICRIEVDGGNCSCRSVVPSMAPPSQPPAAQSEAVAWRNKVAFLKVDGTWRVDDNAIDAVLDEFLAEIERLSAPPSPARSEAELSTWAREWHWNDCLGTAQQSDPTIYPRDLRMLKAFLAALTQPQGDDTREAVIEEACVGIDADFMTSETHHPGYVLIPTAKFEAIRAALSRSSTDTERARR